GVHRHGAARSTACGRRESAEHAGARRAARRDGRADDCDRALVRRRRLAGVGGEDPECGLADRRAARARVAISAGRHVGLIALIKELPPLEAVGVLFSVAYLVLAIRENIWCWPAA